MNAAVSQTSGVAYYAEDPRIDQGTKAFLQILNNSGGPALETLSPEAARLVLVNAQASIPVDVSGIETTEKTITYDGYTVKLHIVRPEGVKEVLPVFLFIHGGGWVLGDFPTHQRLVRDLVVHSGYCAVFVNYTPSPEARYPQALNEIYATTQWVAEHGAEINVDGKRLAIIGNSAGGDLAAATCLMAKHKSGPKISLQILLWPVTNADFELDSYKQFGEDRFLTTSVMKWMWDQYVPDLEKRKEIYAAPLQASVEQLKGLPPTLIQVAENDILRDEGEAYGCKLDKAGVTVTTIRYNGMIHDFGLLNGLATLPATRSLFVHAAAELTKYLG
ncbi:alpha/beta hydrolase [Xanthocytophaga agilis]|uniref:Alpha/beta hydrolase n=1 Tax=Xanthocytophaga agilis TaxID=3048010 RepID=A0AAE3RAN9_9BACT|nr:alpha/beta hydrolase [Xanthocytophaga agilis]MDJ1506774.1 alpha/beta hydrolase [Xanthocytophaga agilis]